MRTIESSLIRESWRSILGGIVILFSGIANAATPGSLSATSMTLSPSGAGGAGASGTYQLWSNGSLSSNVSFPVSGTATFDITAFSSNAGGAWANMALKIDGTVVKNFSVSSSTLSNYTYSGNVTAGTHTISIAFTNDYFANGQDRNLNVGTIKISDSATAESWSRCASENQYCSFTGTQTVRYGANGTYVKKSFTGGVNCSNSVFGDPLPGIVKACDVLGGSSSPPPTPTPVQSPAPGVSWLFSGSFANATLGPKNGDFSFVTGIDPVSGSNWGSTFWSGRFGYHHYNRGEDTKIITTTGPDGKQTTALRIAVLSGSNSDSSTQGSFMLMPGTSEQGPIYQSVWVQLGEDLSKNLHPGEVNGSWTNWRNVWEMKTGDATANNSGNGDFRISLGFKMLDNGKVVWHYQTDTNANGNVAFKIFNQADNTTVPVPAAGQWFRLETFVDRDAGRFVAKYNGQVLFDVYGTMWGQNRKPWNRIFNLVYTDAYNLPATQNITNIQFLNYMP